MEELKKCSNKKHSEIDAINYCVECKLYLCNKCSNYHVELYDNHHINNLNKKIQDIFTGLCPEANHKDELEFFCKTHNKLCCAACLSKIKGKGKGQHFGCEVCLIKEIENEKKNKLNQNIKYLEESSKNIESSLKKLKEINENVNKTKEEIKIKISKLFTKIRNMINEREDKLLSELDNVYNNTYFKEDLIKKGEKLPNQIKEFLEKVKTLNKEWNDDDKFIERINDCINIENSINNIIEINQNIENNTSKQINIIFLPDNKQFGDLEEKIKQFGEIIKLPPDEKIGKIKKPEVHNIKDILFDEPSNEEDYKEEDNNYEEPENDEYDEDEFKIVGKQKKGKKKFRFN